MNVYIVVSGERGEGYIVKKIFYKLNNAEHFAKEELMNNKNNWREAIDMNPDAIRSWRLGCDYIAIFQVKVE